MLCRLVVQNTAHGILWASARGWVLSSLHRLESGCSFRPDVTLRSDKAACERDRFSKVRACGLGQQPNVRSTIQRLGSTTKLFAASDRLKISSGILASARTFMAVVAPWYPPSAIARAKDGTTCAPLQRAARSCRDPGFRSETARPTMRPSVSTANYSRKLAESWRSLTAQ